MDKKSYYIFGFAFLIFIIAIFLYLRSISNMKQYVEQVNHTHNVIALLEKLSGEIKSAQMMPSELGKHHKDALMELYRADIDNIPSSIKNLRKLVADNKPQQKRVDALSKVYNEHIEWMLRNNITDSMPLQEQNDHFRNIVVTQRLIDAGIDIELKLLKVRQDEYEYSSDKTNVLMGLFLIISSFLIVGTAISNFMEIKKREGVELFLESILNTSQNGIITYEAIRNKNEITDFKVIFANEAAEKQIGIKASSIIGQSFLSVSPTAIHSGMMKRYIRILETGKRDEFETSTLRNNSRQWYKVVLAKLNDGFTATFHNITELKNNQQELQEKVELLQSTNSELEQFAYVASHDLQEPLRKIKTYASLIDERFNEPSVSFAKVYLGKVMQSADRMSTLIGDLLNLSHLTKDTKAFVQTDLNQILRNVLIDFELVIKEKNAVVTCAELPSMECIPLQMNQLFYNLINNALKFSVRERFPEINITVDLAEKEDIRHFNLDHQLIYHKINFQDNGIGFDPKYADKIFVIFQRLNSRLNYSGSGIGLALCRKIALNHHGIINAEGKEGEGATFICILPEKQPANKLNPIEPSLQLHSE
jgi:PAS domain S-box-containing protein